MRTITTLQTKKNRQNIFRIFFLKKQKQTIGVQTVETLKDNTFS